MNKLLCIIKKFLNVFINFDIVYELGVCRND